MLARRKSYTHTEARRVADWLRSEKGSAAADAFINRHVAAYYDFHPDSEAAFKSIRHSFKVHSVDSPYRRDEYLQLLVEDAHECDRDQFRLWIDKRLAQADVPEPETSSISEVTPTDPPQQPETGANTVFSDVMVRTPYHIKIDPHMARAASLINRLGPWSESTLLRLYFIVRHIDMRRRYQDGQDARSSVTKSELRAFLKHAGLYSRTTFNRWLTDATEAGYFRSVTSDTIYYAGLTVIAELLLTCLPDAALPCFMGNQAVGGRMVWVDCRGSLQRWQGRCLGAWLEQRERPQDNGVTIPNSLIADLWGVSVRTVIDWRDAAKIPCTRNFAPNDTSRQHTQLPNTYTAPDDTRTHNKTGQSRKVRQIANRELIRRGFNPDLYCDVGETKHRLYFTDSPKLSAQQRIAQYRRKHGHPHGLVQYAHSDTQQTAKGAVSVYQAVY